MEAARESPAYKEDEEIRTRVAATHTEMCRRFVALFKMMGCNPVECSCGVTMYWVPMKSGKNNPFTAEGISHFADCPNANKHRKGR